MEESQAPGIIFSQSAISSEELNQLIAQQFISPEIKLLIAALPPTAELFLVGGCLRDFLCAKSAFDIDLTCSLAPKQIKSALQSANIRTIDTGIEHGTLTALFKNETKIEITSFRQPGVRSDFALGTSIEQDLLGRDFTLNAIAFDLKKLQLIDPYNGLVDLKNNLLRTPGAAEERLLEDPARILRAVRFGPAAGRKVTSELAQSLIKHVSLLESVAVERIRVELEKILLTGHTRSAFMAMRDWHIIQTLLPEVVATFDFAQNEFHHEDVFQHTLSVVENIPAERILRWAALFHDLGKPATLSIGPDNRRHFYNHEDVSAKLAERIMFRLKFSEKDRTSINMLVQLHMRPITCGAPGARRLLRDLGPLFESWMHFKKADRPPIYSDSLLKKQFDAFCKLIETERARTVGSVFDPLAVDGFDLQELGIKPGKLMGEVLRDLRETVLLKPELNTKEILLKLTKEIIDKKAQIKL